MTRLPDRRALLKGSAAIGALAITPGCRDKTSSSQAIEPAPGTLRDHLRTLILVLGPWPVERNNEAESLISRYLKNERRAKRFGQNADGFARLATRFAHHPPAIDSIDLAPLPQSERSALLALTADLYSVMQVRFAISGIPSPGQCIADPAWHTAAPSS